MLLCFFKISTIGRIHNLSISVKMEIRPLRPTQPWTRQKGLFHVCCSVSGQYVACAPSELSYRWICKMNISFLKWYQWWLIASNCAVVCIRTKEKGGTRFVHSEPVLRNPSPNLDSLVVSLSQRASPWRHFLPYEKAVCQTEVHGVSWCTQLQETFSKEKCIGFHIHLPE